MNKTNETLKETIHTSSDIVLFGRPVDDLAVAPNARGKGALKLEEKQFARIYGFSFDGAYFEIPTPVLFAVKGDGMDADKIAVPGPDPLQKEFVGNLFAWVVTRSDETVRLDVETGKFGGLLLDIAGDGAAGVSGARVSGARVSGARVSGARVSGARVSGARISGARGDASD